jgi:hypothetical protein
MSTVCKICGTVRKDYKNVYGTRCSGCGQLIRPESIPIFIQKKEIEKNILQNKVREKVRN